MTEVRGVRIFVGQVDHQIVFALLGLACVPLPFFQNVFAFIEFQLQKTHFRGKGNEFGLFIQQRVAAGGNLIEIFGHPADGIAEYHDDGNDDGACQNGFQVIAEGDFVDIKGVVVVQMEKAGQKAHHCIAEPPANQLPQQENRADGHKYQRQDFSHQFSFKEDVFTAPRLFFIQFCTPLPTRS